MNLQNSSTAAAILEPTAEVLAIIRRRVQGACEHKELKPVVGDERRSECSNCGYRTSTLRLAARMSR
jgi:hypothetical protein